MKITLDSFLAVLSKCGLVPPERLAALVEAYRAQHPEVTEGQPFAEALIAQNVITPWQAEKLLLGKHKGFFLGKYRLLALLGKGGMSSVYLAEHVLMRRRCAIKVLPAKRVNDTSYLGRFHREAQAVAALDHPNIVRAYDVDHEQDGSVEIHFLVMEFVDGLSLLDLVNRDGPLAPAAAAEYIRQSALGLEHAHRAGLIHRDVKPGNLLVDNAGVVKVMDLGLARFFSGEEKESLTIQYDEKVLGTADYLAPEQAVDSHDIDARADIYSLGCTLYFLLVGHPPFTQGTLPQRLMAHQTKEPPPIEAERKDVPASLLAIMKQMMAKQPAERYPTAGAVAEACLEWLQSNGGAAWDTMRAKLAESGIDLGGSSGRLGTGSARVSPAKAAQLTAAARAAPAPAPSKPVAKSPVPAPTRKAASPVVPQAVSAAAGDNELGAFLANLSGGAAVVAAPAREEPAPTIRMEPSAQPPKKASPAKPVNAPAAAAHAVKKSAPVVEAIAVKRPAAAAVPVAEALLAEPAEAEAAEVEPVVEAEGVDAPPATLKRPSSKLQLPKQYLVYGGAAAALLLVVVVAVAVFSGGDDTPAAPPVNAANAGATTPSTNSGTLAPPVAPATPATPARPVPASPAEITVGPTGNFATINEAIQYALDNPPLLDPNEPRLIKVAGGQTYPERISIQNWNLGVLHIRSEGEQSAILKPGGKEPVVRLENANKVTFERLTLDASGKAIGVELVGPQNRVLFAGCEVSGFSAAGITGDRAGGLGSGRLEFRDLTLRTPAAAAAGIRLTGPTEVSFGGGVQFVTLANVQCQGSFGVGMELIGPLTQVTIQKCSFHNSKTGLRLGVSGLEVDSVVIENNTFHHLAQGIVIDQPPARISGVVIHKNLFADLSGAEIAFEAPGDEARMQALRSGASVGFNATQRPADQVQSNAWDLFANNGQTGVAPEFESTEPAAPGFLKPKNAALKPAQTPGADKFIGAVSP